MKILIVLGTRPEAIKLAPVIHALKNREVETIVCVSGQHKEMVQPMLDLFSITADSTLQTMAAGQSLNVLASKLLAELDRVLEHYQPDWVIVQGDTTTAMSAGLAAFHRKINIAHVEAGLRTGDLNSPWPEEANRSLLARISQLHFAPTVAARHALLRESIDNHRIVVTGNTVVDAIKLALSITTPTLASDTLKHAFPGGLPPSIILVTCHRRENFGVILESICLMLQRLCLRYPDYHWVFPVHLNPQVNEPVYRLLSGITNLTLLPPVDYLSSLQLIARASLVVTDSGGIQEEAPSFGVPVVVMRNHTERMEGVDAGVATLAGQEVENIEQAIDYWLNQQEYPSVLQHKISPYGDGKAAQRIVNKLLGQSVNEFLSSPFDL